jgi:hypothetical protein
MGLADSAYEPSHNSTSLSALAGCGNNSGASQTQPRLKSFQRFRLRPISPFSYVGQVAPLFAHSPVSFALPHQSAMA